MPPNRANPDDLPAGGPKRPEDLALLRIFRDVETHHLEAAFSELNSSRVRSRAILHLDHEFNRQVGFAWSGAYRFCAISPTGETTTLLHVRPPHGFGFAMAVANLGYGDIHRLTADRGGLLLGLPVGVFRALAQQSHAFAVNLNKAMAHLALLYGARVYELAVAPVHTRLISELIRRGERAVGKNDQRTLIPSPTHATLANQIGATREAVSRHLRSLADEGLIELHRRRITIVSMRTLRAIDARVLGRRFRSPSGE